MKEVVLGIDIGGTFTKYGIVDRDGNCLMQNSIATNSGESTDSAEGFIAEASKILKNDLLKFKDITLKGIGIGAPNGNYYKGTIEDAANLKWKGIVPFVDIFKKYFDVPIVLTNDANAAAIGEKIYGNAKDLDDFLVVTLGTGLGSGFVSNGELIYGHDGFAGELGHTTVRHNGRQCGCGRKGCLETYVSATGIKRTVFRLLAESMEESELRNVSFNDLTAEMITKAAKRGDKIAQEAFLYTASILGQKLADAVAITSPKAIFLLGGLAKAGDLILKPTKESLENNLLTIYKNKVQVLLSGMVDLDVAIMGAAALVWKELDRTR
jgi:glucokinase